MAEAIVWHVDRAGTTFPWGFHAVRVGPLFSEIGGALVFTAHLSTAEIRDRPERRRYQQPQLPTPTTEPAHG